MPRKQNHRNILARVADHAWAAHWLELAAMVGIFIAVCILYLPALHGGFLWDDDANVTSPELRSLHGLYRIWFEWGATQTYYPVLHTLYWVESQLWGDATLGYHIVSILFHSISVFLVYWIVRRLIIPGAALAAAVFAVHPVYVESVAWITEQKNTFSVMFSLAAVLTYLHFDESRRRGAYALALALFVLALASKTAAVTLPVGLVVILWWKRPVFSLRRDLAPLVPWFALSLIAGVFTVWYERVYVGAHGAPFALSPLRKCLLASRAVWFYLAKLFWPSELILIYPRWNVNSRDAWQYIYVVGLIVLLAGAWAVHQRWRGPWAALLFFLGTLFPLLGFFPTYIFTYTYVCDHFQYFPSLGIVVLVSALVALAINRLNSMGQRIGQIVCLLVLGILAYLTWQQTCIYTDAVTMYEAIIARNPTCWMAHNNLGLRLADVGKSQDAIEQYQKALEVNPNFPEAHNNWGLELEKLGRKQEAVDHYRLALGMNPDYPMANNNLGNALLEQGDLPGAIEHFQKALQFKRGYSKAHFNLGNAFKQSGRIEEAIDQYQQALILDPEYFKAYNNLGNALKQLGRLPEAIDHYQRALQIKPDYTEAWINLASAYEQTNRSAEAFAAAQKALAAAQSQRQSALIQRMEAWLSSHHDESSNSTDVPGRTETLRSKSNSGSASPVRN